LQGGFLQVPHGGLESIVEGLPAIHLDVDAFGDGEHRGAFLAGLG
jgi:hypothetical protein